MNLGLSRIEHDRLKDKFLFLQYILENGPKSSIANTLKECNSVINDKSLLLERIQRTEEESLVDGKNSIAEIRELCETVSNKIECIRIVMRRKDLDEAEKQSIFKELEIYESTKETLVRSLDLCAWKTELI